jgi:uncharacterized protein DUF2817
MPIDFDLDCFAADYSTARHKFVEACAASSGQLRSFFHPLSSPTLELATECYWVGPEDADNVLVIISATHGVEGFCGSAAQIQWLRQNPRLPDSTALLLIHALNPYGFAHCRRVNEDNVDLNRNFIDFSHPPVNPGYRELATALTPTSRNELATSRKVLDNYAQCHNQSALELAVSGGQYDFADGLFYGGKQPSWSNHLIHTVFNDYRLNNKHRLAVIDIHSGLGPYGYGEIICDHPPGSASTLLAKDWFGDSVTEPACGTSTSVPKYGLLDYAWHPIIADRGCYVTLEFGTYPVTALFAVLQEENFCRHRAVSATEQAAAQQAMRDYFYPAKQDWQEMILFRSQQVISQALKGIAA